ncbi:BKACE family enzyme [Halocynthiibacter styelae]|uniref:3-keto-5-aminohexanoate cleavage protein n=1 Tax=Halocynthiibacter styelae TaxID=2761955 RepID=A0A8J7IY45_9RHOB|nr:3-keto-5-aminohexanoate cleavage protein [Paenihalocynthiibacter styelae]MBI1495003.1 3-keto-5-aminohexanoate cleavage protein [Paenihalocynthiibacter styelae]
MPRKIILTCAVTGSIHTPSMSPYLPVTPDEIATSAIEAAEAGASVLHLHARDPENGKPSSDIEVFRQFLPRIKDETDAVINLTTGGSSQMTVEQRLSAPAELAPEMCSLNMGSINFGLFPMKDRYTDWKHDWEEPFLENTRDVVFKNTFRDIEAVFSMLGDAGGAKFEFECYDVGHIQSVAFYLKQNRIKAPVFLQFVMGVLGGIDASPQSLMMMKETADRLLGDQYKFSVLAAGRQQMTLGTMAVILGGNVRVGLEDSLMIGRGELAVSNAQQVIKIRTVLEELGYEIATPDEAREMLQLKGADKVGF